MERIRIKVPATSANLGSGFDCMGLALELYNYFEFEKLKAGLIIEGCDEKHKNDQNLAYVAYKAVCDKMGVSPAVKITFLETNVPLSRGLGSSATLICAGAYAATKLHGEKLAPQEVFEICTHLEGHPDNIAPALFGSLCASVFENHKLYTEKFPVSDKIHFTIIVPDFEVKTSDARAALPDTVRRSDAVFNLARATLLTRAFERADFELLRVATKDALHEGYRRSLFRNIEEVEAECYKVGAATFNISGAGSTCICTSEKSIADKLNEVLITLDNGWVATELAISKDGIKPV